MCVIPGYHLMTNDYRQGRFIMERRRYRFALPLREMGLTFWSLIGEDDLNRRLIVCWDNGHFIVVDVSITPALSRRAALSSI